MQRRQYQVSRQRRLDGNFGRLQVTDLADHHHIGVLPQYGAQTARKGHIDFGINLSLAYTGKHVLHGIFNRQDIARALIDARQPCIQCRGLTRASGARDQNDAMRSGQCGA